MGPLQNGDSRAERTGVGVQWTRWSYVYLRTDALTPEAAPPRQWALVLVLRPLPPPLPQRPLPPLLLPPLLLPPETEKGPSILWRTGTSALHRRGSVPFRDRFARARREIRGHPPTPRDR